MRPTDLVLDAVAVYRLTRLVTTDTLLHDVRERIVEAAYTSEGRAEAERHRAAATSWSEVAHDDEPDAPKLATLITCRWCAGMYVAFGVVAARRCRWWRPVRDALVMGSAAALLAGLEE